MGFFSSAWSIIKASGKVVKEIASKAWDFANTKSSTEDYEKLQKVVAGHVQKRADRSLSRNSAPNFDQKRQDDENAISKIRKSIAVNDRELQSTKSELSVQIDLARLRGAAEILDRAKANIKIHSASLMTHHESIRNTNGLIDDVNSIRYGFNVLRNIMSAKVSDEEKAALDKIDIEKKRGAISKVSSFDAYDKTRQLLVDEIVAVEKIAKIHLSDLSDLKLKAESLDPDLSEEVINYIDSAIIPRMVDVRERAKEIKRETDRLPMAVRDEKGSLTWDNDGNLQVRKKEIIDPSD